jgi:hypothetical protein
MNATPETQAAPRRTAPATGLTGHYLTEDESGAILSAMHRACREYAGRPEFEGLMMATQMFTEMRGAAFRARHGLGSFADVLAPKGGQS